MYSLLTGQPHADHRNETALAKESFTVAAHHRAMRHLFVEAGLRLGNGNAEAAAVLVAAAHAHAEAAKTAPATLSDPRDETPTTGSPASRVRINGRRDSDSL